MPVIAALIGLQWGRDLSIAERTAHDTDTGATIYASMGPRSFDRGKRASRSYCRAIASSFNGAAIFRSRKAPLQSGPRQPRARFNGAAIFRSRKGHNYGDLLPNVYGLQWGRDLSIAESWPPPCRGPAPCGLQWGRDLSIAERPYSWADSIYCLRFNGAAIFRSRKDRATHCTVLCLYSGFNGAAIFRSRKGSRCWPMSSRPKSFNGAAIFRSRKVEPLSLIEGKANRFNGAAIFRSRKGESYCRPPPPVAGFNGAAIFRSRKGKGLPSCVSGASSFNGAAIFRSRKVEAGMTDLPV